MLKPERQCQSSSLTENHSPAAMKSESVETTTDLFKIETDHESYPNDNLCHEEQIATELQEDPLKLKEEARLQRIHLRKFRTGCHF